MFAAAPFIIDRAPYESSMGLVQRVFYFHVPAGLVMFGSAFVCGIASALYLARRRPTADRVAFAAAELAVVLGVIVLTTGPLWARKAWGVWWDWEPRHRRRRGVSQAGGVEDMVGILARAAWALGIVAWLAVALIAQEPAQSEFRTITADEAALERLPATPFVFWAYAIVWLVLIGYVFSLWRRLGRVEAELQTLHTRLGERRP
jgi:CcmD family protein